MSKRIVVRREALEKWLQAQTVTVYDIQGKPFA
jgi:hypothetical protein